MSPVRRTLTVLAALLVPAVALAGVAGCAGGDGGDAVAYLATDLVTGEEVSLEAWRDGRPAVLVSWATWCQECDEQLAALAAFAASPASGGLAVAAVNLDAADVEDEIRAKVDAHGLTTALWRDRRNDFKRSFAALGVPTTVVVGADGTVQAMFPGAADFDDDAVVAALDRARGGAP
jgi:thiol-disulfide isomerase/thioredoxin